MPTRNGLEVEINAPCRFTTIVSPSHSRGSARAWAAIRIFMRTRVLLRFSRATDSAHMATPKAHDHKLKSRREQIQAAARAVRAAANLWKTQTGESPLSGDSKPVPTEILSVMARFRQFSQVVRAQGLR